MPNSKELIKTYTVFVSLQNGKNHVTTKKSFTDMRSALDYADAMEEMANKLVPVPTFEYKIKCEYERRKNGR